MPDMPPRPANIIIEKWLPYRVPKRRIVHQRSASAHAPLVPRNLIIEWEAPDVDVMQECKDLGMVDANPEEYVRRFGRELVKSDELPRCNHNHNENKGHASRASGFNRAEHSSRRCGELSNAINGGHQYRDRTIARSYGIEAASTQIPTARRYNFEFSKPVESKVNTIEFRNNYRNRSPVKRYDYEPIPDYRGHYTQANSRDSGCDVHTGQKYFQANAKYAGYDLPELEGDVEALNLIDLNRYGLQGYRDSLSQSSSTASFNNNYNSNNHLMLSRYREDRFADHV
jgi:hypothetical protein